MMPMNGVLFLFTLLLNYSTRTLALIPKPTNYAKTTTACNLPLDTKFQHDYPSCYILTSCLKRFESRLITKHMPMPDVNSDDCIIDSINIEIRNGCDESEYGVWPSESMDESCKHHRETLTNLLGFVDVISIQEGEIKISSNEIWGTMRALETILQLIYTNNLGENIIFKGLIEDNPKYSYRGLLVNTAKYFIPIDTLRRTIDTMAMVKMNVLHWHITDDESFPYASSVYPELSEKGAFHPQTCTYNELDITSLLEYARLRGVRVIPELDTPGHTLSWGKAYPDLLTECYDKSEPDGNFGPLNPARQFTYEFLENIYKEVILRFPDGYIHLGGNDIYLHCWKSNPEIIEFMEEMQFGNDYYKLEAYYMENLVQIVLNATSPEPTNTPIIYQEIFEHGFNVHLNNWN
ncbi:unnamed protein product [Trichobilharzia szidati]|nr:unnamed protein product [Trichobilharzia szidati]